MKLGEHDTGDMQGFANSPLPSGFLRLSPKEIFPSTLIRKAPLFNFCILRFLMTYLEQSVLKYKIKFKSYNSRAYFLP